MHAKNASAWNERILSLEFENVFPLKLKQKLLSIISSQHITIFSVLKFGTIFKEVFNFPINFIFTSLSWIISFIFSTKEISFLLKYNFSKELKELSWYIFFTLIIDELFIYVVNSIFLIYHCLHVYKIYFSL